MANLQAVSTLVPYCASSSSIEAWHVGATMHNVLFVMAGAQALAAPAAPSLYVVGCGVLGRATCRLWREAHPGARIIGETASTASHAELERLGATPATRAARGTPAKCANVLFCAPPSAYGDEEYAAEVTEAARSCWDGSGAFLMASSGGVFAEDAGGVVDEAGATLDTPRARKLLGAERAALAAGGAVVRLAGLYTRDRGAHGYWYKQGEVRAAGDGSLLNFLHYDDAAAFAARALEARVADEVLLAADGSPRTRAGCVDAVARHPLFRDRARPTFVAGDAPPRHGPAGGGRVYDCARSAARVGGWAPAWPSLDAFFAADAEKPSEVADRLP